MGEFFSRALVFCLSLAVFTGCAMTQESHLDSEMIRHTDLFGQSQGLYAQGDYQQALAVISRAIEQEPRRAELWNGRGYMKMQVRDLTGAVQDFSMAVKLDNAMGQYRENLGVALLEAGKPIEALAELTKAVQVDPDSDLAFNHRGLTNSRLGRYDQAISDFTTAMSY